MVAVGDGGAGSTYWPPLAATLRPASSTKSVIICHNGWRSATPRARSLQQGGGGNQGEVQDASVEDVQPGVDLQLAVGRAVARRRHREGQWHGQRQRHRYDLIL